MTAEKWVFTALEIRDQGIAYLSATRYRNYDIDDLANGKPKEQIVGPVQSECISKDGRPPAEIVATARMIQIADYLIEIWFSGDHNAAPSIMFLFGHQHAAASMFMRDPGQLAKLAIEPDGYLEIARSNFTLSKTKARDNFQRWMNKLSAGKKDKRIANEISILLCGWRKSPEFRSIPDNKVVDPVWERYIESPEPKERWPKKYHILTTPTILKYLRMSNAVGPPISREPRSSSKA